MASPLPPSVTASSPPDPGLVEAAILRLRAEQEASDSATNRAILTHEIGVLEESVGNEADAARDQLAAVNEEPEFREPLERLVVIIERRRSHKNLGKLLERLVRVADGPEERSRALTLSAACAADHGDDLDAARVMLEEAVDARPDDAVAWYALEVLAGRLGDADLRARALGARAERCQHAGWRALLLIDRADLLLAAGQLEAALATLDEAVGCKGEATFFALGATAEAGRRAEREDIVARALDAQAQLVLRSVAESSVGDALGVPKRSATPRPPRHLRAAS